MSVVVVMRGVPGSGKSSFNKILNELCEENDLSVAIHSTDDKFMVDGEFIFDQRKRGYYHKLNKEDFDESLVAEIDVVSVDNTNLRQRDYNAYVKSARDNGASSVIAVVFYPSDAKQHVSRNSHGASLEVIENMITHFSNSQETIGVDKELVIFPEKFSDRKLRLVAGKIISAVLEAKKDTQ